jgi:hypothetical protein
VKPVAHLPRRFPVALNDQVQEKLDNMVKEDIIAKVDQPTDWVSSMLVVRKPTMGPDGKADIRICLDPKDPNGAIKHEHFLMATIKEVATRLTVMDFGKHSSIKRPVFSLLSTLHLGGTVGNVCRLA